MVRNILLLISSMAVLAILFYGYVSLTDHPVSDDAPHREPGDELPSIVDANLKQPLRAAGGIEIPGGGEIVMRRFDPRTGRATDILRCDDWEPVQGSDGELRLTRPELTMLMPSGMIATVSADTGQIMVERIDRKQPKPKVGWLSGNVTIVVDQETRPERAPRTERPHDLITIGLERVDFDLDLGSLRSEGPLKVQSDAFEVSGSGLNLVWNAALNRLDTLRIEHGEKLVVTGLGQALGAVGAAPPGPRSGERPPPANARRRARNGAKRGTTYLCTLTGDVLAEQFGADGQRAASLMADRLELTFDVGLGSAGETPRLGARPSDATGSAPASGPADLPEAPRPKLVVHWTGPLTLTGGDVPSRVQRSRRRISATGGPIRLVRGDGVIQCGALEVYDESQQVWLYASADGLVHLDLGNGDSATAESVYLDRRRNLVKLVANVELQSRRGRDNRGLALHAAHWAELRLGVSGDAPAGELDEGPFGAGGLDSFDHIQSASFVGAVDVDFGRQKLTAGKLDLTFRPHARDGGGGARSLDSALESAQASGDVALRGDDESLRCAELNIAFGLDPKGELFPRRVEAVGVARLAQKRSEATARKIVALLDPAPAGPDAGIAGRGAAPARGSQDIGSRFLVRSLEMHGDARLRDAENRVYARGESLSATFGEARALQQATILGTPGAPGRIRASDYAVQGERIDIDRAAQTMDVPGAARLTLRTRRGLQGQLNDEASEIDVKAARSLHVDGRENTVRFEDHVVAKNREDRLQCKRLTIHLQDAPEKPPEPAPPSILDVVREFRRMAGQAGDTQRPLDLAAEEAPLRRKEIRLLVAEQALVESETPERSDGLPLVAASLEAPRLEVRVPEKEIRTSGVTTLLLTNRRAGGDGGVEGEALGLPTALMTRGASQTAMRCENGLTYVFGTENVQRRDAAVLEGDVFFVHRAGRDMVNLEQMLPASQRDPQSLAKLPSRNAALQCDRLECEFAADDGKGRGGLGVAPLRLTWLLAAGNVYLNDRGSEQQRQVNAQTLEFNRERGLIHVSGSDRSDARIYAENMRGGPPDIHTGHEWIVDLASGRIRSPGPTEGVLGRP